MLQAVIVLVSLIASAMVTSTTAAKVPLPPAGVSKPVGGFAGSDIRVVGG